MSGPAIPGACNGWNAASGSGKVKGSKGRATNFRPARADPLLRIMLPPTGRATHTTYQSPKIQPSTPAMACS